MNKGFLALALALSVIPIAAVAQDSNASAPTADQRQAMRQTFQQFAQQEAQLHQQMRYQMLSAMSPVQRRAVGALIGELAVAPNPDPQAAAKRLDAMLSSGEQQRIIAAHTSFESQSRQLHEQMREQLQRVMPDAHGDMMKQRPEHSMGQRQIDAGTLLLMGLSPQPMMGMHGGWPMMMHGEGPPPH
jgi:hypothetical protein